MAQHKYASGDVISLGSRMPNVPIGPFRIISNLPSERGELSYKVRCDEESFERIVQEHQIGGLIAPPLKSSADAVFTVTG